MLDQRITKAYNGRVGTQDAEKCLCVLFSRLVTVSVGFTQIYLVISSLLLLLISKHNSRVLLWKAGPLHLLLCHGGNSRPYSGSWVSSLPGQQPSAEFGPHQRLKPQGQSRSSLTCLFCSWGWLWELVSYYKVLQSFTQYRRVFLCVEVKCWLNVSCL